MNKTPRNLKITAIIFGLAHLLGMYALLLFSMGSAMTRFDGREAGLSVGIEVVLMKVVSVLLFPFGYLPIPLIAPWINSAFWAYIVYRLLKYFSLKRVPTVSQ